MKVLDATQAKNNFGVLLQESLVEPIGINKNKRLVSVPISAREFERLRAIEDTLLIAEAEEAEREGFIGVKASIDLLTEKLNEATKPNKKSK